MGKFQRVGLHVSAAGGVENAPGNAYAIGAECFQFFSRSPRGGAASPISEGQAKQFRSACEEYGYESYIHTPYYINFASPKKSLAAASTRVVREELERGSMLGVKYVVTHMGSAKDYLAESTGSKTPAFAKASAGRQNPNIQEEVLKKVAEGIRAIYSGGKKFSSELLLEICAGSGETIGDTFEELAYLLKAVGRKDVHICLDTCHLFASGYDVRSKAAIDDTMKQFKKHIGLAEFKLAHMNDSKADLGGHRDRHEHMGKGKIGAAGLKALLAHPDFQNVNFILETKHDNEIENDLEFLKKWRKQK
ncbi:MAG: deoxyribonuclease IV [Patescibacteria group bacterium]